MEEMMAQIIPNNGKFEVWDGGELIKSCKSIYSANKILRDRMKR